MALAVPALVRSLGRWSDDPLVRFGALGFLATQIMFLLFPWKPAHLLPSLLTLVLWIAASERNRRPYLWVLVAAVAVNGLFAVRVSPPTGPTPAAAPASSRRCRGACWSTTPAAGSSSWTNRRPPLGAWSCTLEPLRGRGE